jgi:pilus assembly protein Flp/PilA
MKSLITRFLKNEAGATAIEYGLIAAGIAIVIIAAVGSVGTNLNTTFSSVASNVRWLASFLLHSMALAKPEPVLLFGVQVRRSGSVNDQTGLGASVQKGGKEVLARMRASWSSSMPHVFYRSSLSSKRRNIDPRQTSAEHRTRSSGSRGRRVPMPLSLGSVGNCRARLGHPQSEQGRPEPCRAYAVLSPARVTPALKAHLSGMPVVFR